MNLRSINSVENWRQRWDHFGLVGLFEGRHTGRPRKLSDEEQRELGDLARNAGGTAGSIQCLWKRAAHTPLSTKNIKAYLTDMGFRYKRYRLSLKDKRDSAAFDRAKGVVASLQSMAKMEQCSLLYFDESGFSPNPPVQYGWAPIRQTRCAEAGVHRQRVNVLGALDQDGKLIWKIKEQHTVRDDVIAFDSIAGQPLSVPCIVLLDNANIHRGEAMELKRDGWQQSGCICTICPHTAQSRTESKSCGSRPNTSGASSPD
jgi:transposase